MYEKTVWQVGDVITAEKLNKIENAIEEASDASSSGGSIVTLPATITNTSSKKVEITNYIKQDANSVVSWKTSRDILMPDETKTIALLPSFWGGEISSYNGIVELCLQNLIFGEDVSVSSDNCNLTSIPVNNSTGAILTIEFYSDADGEPSITIIEAIK